ncbi:MAG: hypothetical protein AAB377_02290, partial [Patescibacteria group bacterium]
MNFREFLALFRAGREGQGKELKPAKIFRCGSEGAAEGGCGGNSAAPERSAGAKRRRSVPFKIGSRIFKQRAPNWTSRFFGSQSDSLLAAPAGAARKELGGKIIR